MREERKWVHGGLQESAVLNLQGLIGLGGAGGEKGQNLLPGLLVQIACGLIRNDELRLGQDGSGNAPKSLL